MEHRCVTVRIRPAFEDEPQIFISVARYEHPRERELVTTVGAGATRAKAQRDLAVLLEGEGFEAPIALDECREPRERNTLVSVARYCAMTQGAVIVHGA